MNTKAPMKHVPKGWGWELHIHNTPEYCGKLLFMFAGKKFSWHYHVLKDETFYIQSGKVKLSYGDTDDISHASELILEKGMSFHIYRGLRHRICALKDSEIFEFSTQDFNSDSIRIIQGD